MLPTISGQETIKAFSKDGWQESRQSGSHVTLVKSGVAAILTVPLHKELKKGTLRSLIRASGLTVEEFVALL